MIWVLISPTGSHSESVNRAAAVCDVVWGPRPWGEPALSSQAWPGQREQHGSVLSVCTCHRSQASLVPSVSPLHCRLVPPGMISNTAASEHGQSVTCGFHLFGAIMKCGNVFNLETFGGMTSWWIFPNVVLKGKPPLDKNSRRVVFFQSSWI